MQSVSLWLKRIQYNLKKRKIGPEYSKIKRNVHLFQLLWYLILHFLAFDYQAVQQEINSRLSISDYLIKPIQRITKYQLLLKVKLPLHLFLIICHYCPAILIYLNCLTFKDFLKYSHKAGLDCQNIEVKKSFFFLLVLIKYSDKVHNALLVSFETLF